MSKAELKNKLDLELDVLNLVIGKLKAQCEAEGALTEFYNNKAQSVKDLCSRFNLKYINQKLNENPEFICQL